MRSLQNLLTKEECEEILHAVHRNPLISFEINKIDDVSGYLAEYFNLTITYQSNNGPSNISYFVKTLPIFNLQQLDYVSESGIFKKEALLYKNLLSDLFAIYQFGPKCFLAREDVIVLEDLRAQEYKTLNRELYLDEDHCISILKTMAKFHASTIVYENKKGTKLNEKFKEEIKENGFCFVEGQPRYKWLVSVTNCINNLFKSLHLNSNLDVQLLCQRFERFVFEAMPLLLAPSKKFRNVFTHDDLWCNNILFKDKSCIFIDFQLGRYSPPAMDFLTALYLNLDTELVEKNLDKYVDIYYSYLRDMLQSYKIENDELTKEEFEDTLEFYKLPALVESAMFGTHVFISEKLSNHILGDVHAYREFSFINRSKYAVEEFESNPMYKARLTPLLLLTIKHLLEL